MSVCILDGVFAATVNDDDQRRQLHPTATSVNNDRCEQKLPLPPPTLTAIAFDDDRLHHCERQRSAP